MTIKRIKQSVMVVGICLLGIVLCACDRELNTGDVMTTVVPTSSLQSDVMPEATQPPTPTVTPSPTEIPAPTPTDVPVLQPTATATPSPEPVIPEAPSTTPEPEVVPEPTDIPQITPSAAPLVTPTVLPQPPEAYFDNPLVEAALRRAVGNPERVLEPEDFLNVTVLDLHECNLSDVAFLSEFENLQELDLSWNNLTELTSLPALKHLTKLDLSYNFISKIQVLSSYTELAELSLRGNNIESLSDETNNGSVFDGLSKLKRMDLSYNALTGAEELSGFTTLDYLNLEMNQITDFSAVEYVPELIR